MAKIKMLDDRFKKFGTVSFIATTKTNDFISHLENGRVAGTSCNVCKRYFFPPRADCSDCLSSDVDWFFVSGLGKLVFYSKLKFAPKGFEQDLPYSIALLDFEKYKIFGRLDDSVDLSNIFLGMNMSVSVKHLANSRLGYVFS